MLHFLHTLRRHAKNLQELPAVKVVQEGLEHFVLRDCAASEAVRDEAE